MKYLVVGVFLVVLAATLAYAAPMSGTVKSLGSGTSGVPHCQVLDYDIAASDTISSVNAQVECDTTGGFTVNAAAASGAQSGTGSTAVSLSAGAPQAVNVSVSPSVSISGSAYSVDVGVSR